MAVILIIRLIFMILDSNEVRINGCWIQGERDERVECGDFGDKFGFPRLAFVSRFFNVAMRVVKELF